MYNVDLYLDGRYLDPKEYGDVMIHSSLIDHIVNEVYDNAGLKTGVSCAGSTVLRKKENVGTQAPPMSS